MKKTTPRFRPASRAVALEPRILFDGAAAVATTEHLNDGAPAERPAAERQAERPQEAGGVSQPGAGGTLVIIDARVAGYQQLLAGLPANVTVRVVGAGESGLSVIGEALAGGQTFSAVHLISHGSAGSLSLGRDILNSATLASYGAQFQAWGAQLTADADILLYGCDIGAGEKGRAFLQQMASLTGADVAASSDATGAASLGGNWRLETRTGAIEAGIILAQSAQDAYEHLLAAPTIADAVETVRAVNEDSSLAITGITIADSDGNNQTVTLSTANGRLTLASTLGLTGLSGNGTGTVTFTGSLADVNAAINGLIYQGNTDFYGNTSLSISTNDGSSTTSQTVTLSVTAVNDVPTLSGTTPALTVGEGQQGSFSAATPLGIGFTQSNLGLTDVDNLQAQVILKVTGLASRGVLLLDGAELALGSTFSIADINKLVYKHNGDQVLSNTLDTFRLTIDDGAGGVLTDRAFQVQITPVNQLPTVTGAVRVIEGETAVNLFANGNLPTIGTPRGAITIGDPDQAGGVSHTYTLGSLPTRGTLYYSGVAITAGNMASIVITNPALLTYSHNGSEPRVTGYQDTFILKVTDDGGGTGVPGTTNQTITLDIIDNNDDPVLVHSITQRLVEDHGGAPSFVVTPAMLQVSDSDSFDSSLAYTLTAVPDIMLGYFTRGGSLLVVGSIFTQQDIIDGKVVYHVTNYNPFQRLDTIEFTVKDGGIRLYPTERNGGIYDAGTDNLSKLTFSVVVPAGAGSPGSPPSLPSPIDMPTVGGDHRFTLNEAGSYTLQGSDLLASDGTTLPSGLTYRLNTLPSNGTFFLNGVALNKFGSFTQQDIDDGKVTFQHSGAEDFTADFQFTVSNGKLETAAITFYITATPQNDTPTATVGDRVFLAEGGNIAINGSHITLADSDAVADSATVGTGNFENTGIGYANANTLSFVLTAKPTHGYLSLDGGATHLANGAVVTAAQLSAGQLKYYHDGSENYDDGFTLTPVDDQGVAVTAGTNQSSTGSALYVPIVISPLNDAPVFVSKNQLITGEAGPVAQGGSAVIGGATGYDNTRGVLGAGSSTGAAAGAHLIFKDDDNTTIQRQYRITTATAHGQLLLNGIALGVNSVFTQDDLDKGRITYKHDGSEDTLSDKFSYVVSDGDFSANDGQSFAQGTATTSSDFLIEIRPANNKPGVSAPGSLDVVASGTTPVAIPGVSVSDPDLAVVIAGKEENFLRVEVQVLDSGNNPVAGATLSYTATDPNGGRAYVSGKGVAGATLVLQGTREQVNAALATLTVAFSSDEDSSTEKIRVTVDDRLYTSAGALESGASGGANGGVGTTENADGSTINATNNRVTKDITLVVSNLNDTPLITNVSNYSVNEDASLTLSGFTLSDADSFDKNVTVRVELYTDAGRTSLANASTQGALTTGALTGVTASGSGSNTITLSGSMADVQAALNALKFQGATDYNGAGVGETHFYLRTTFTDFGHADVPAGRSVTVDNDITLKPVNDKPVLTVPGNKTLNSGTYLDITSGFNVQDNKDINQGATDYIEVTIAAKDGSTPYGTISIQTPGSALVTGEGTDTVVVKGTNADVKSALNSLRYTPTNPNVDKVVTFTVVADDRSSGVGNGKEGSGVDGNNTDTKTFTVTISGTNDAPVVTAPASVSIAEDSSANTIAGISYADSDDFGGVQRITLSVVHGTVDLSTRTGLTVITGAYGSATVTVEGTKANLNAALASLKYTPTANYHGGDTLTVTADDQGLVGSGGTKTDTRTVALTVTPVNDRPTASTDVTLPAVTEDAANPAGSTLSSLVFGYSDVTDNQTASSGGDTATAFSYIAIVGNAATAAQGTWQISDGAGGWISVPTSGLVTTSALVFSADRQVRFVPSADFNGTPGKLTVRLADASVDLSGKLSTSAATKFDITQAANGGTTQTGAWNSADRTIGTSVTAVNDAPTRGALPTAVQVDEDATNPVGATVSSLFGSTFSDARDTVSGGSSSNTFAGIAITGVTSDKGVWEYWNAGSGTWVAVPADVAEGNAFVLKTTDQLRFRSTTADYNGTPSDALTVRLIDSSAGTPTSGSRPDLSGTHSGGTTAYSDAANAVTLGAVVRPINDAPVLTGTSTNPTYTEGGSAVALIQSGGASDVDLPGSVTFGGGTLTVTLDNYRAGDVLSLAGSPTGVASVSGGNGAALVITLNTAATPATLGAILEALRFSSTSDDPTLLKSGSPDSDRVFSIRLNDGNNVNGASNAGGPASLDSNLLTGTISIVAVNDPPVAVNDTHAVTEDSGVPASGNVITGAGSPNTTADSDPDNLPADLSVSGIRSGSEAAGGAMGAVAAGTSSATGTTVTGLYGTLKIGADGSYTYTLNDANPTVNALTAGQTLSDVFTYTLRDPGNATDTAQLTITIHGSTDAGSLQIEAVDGNGAVGGQATVYEKGLGKSGDSSETTTGTLRVTAPDGIAKVSIGGTEFTIAQLAGFATTPSSPIDTGEGWLTVTGLTVVSGAASAPTEARVSYSYTLKGGVSQPGASDSTDSVALVVTDASVAANTASGTLTVTIVDDVPLAANDAFTVSRNTPLSGSLTGNDSLSADTPHTWAKATDPAHGSVVVHADGTFTYTPAANYNGPDSFTYTITDADGDVSTATVTLTVDDVPVAVNDAFSTAEDTPLNGSLKGNDTPSGDGGNVWSKASDPAHGTVVVNPDGTFTYTPHANYHGSDSFTYTLTDIDGDVSTATVTLTISPVNDVPVAVSDSVSTTEDTPVSGSLKGNATPSGDGGNLWSKASDPAHGTVVVTTDGTLTYTPHADYHGSDSFTYTITYAYGNVSTDTFTITVAPANDPPVAVDDRGHSPDGSPVVIPVLRNDSDVDGDAPLTVTHVAGQPVVPGRPVSVPGGSVTLNGNGTLTFTPAPGTQGEVRFTYQISDGNGGTAAAQVVVTVVPAPTVKVPDAPSSTSTPSLHVNRVVENDQAREPSVFFDGSSFDKVLRLPIPFHPVVYVNREVVNVQNERMASDPLGFSNPGLVGAGTVQSASIGGNLGFDPNLFVMAAVRASQAHGELLGNIVDGRLVRVSLASDRAIPTPDLFDPQAIQLPASLAAVRNLPPDNLAELPPGAVEETPEGAPAAASREAALQEKPGKPSSARGAVAPRAAPSFSEQLRSAGGRPATAGRAALRAPSAT